MKRNIFNLAVILSLGLLTLTACGENNKAAADIVNRMLLDTETNVRAFEGR